MSEENLERRVAALESAVVSAGTFVAEQTTINRQLVLRSIEATNFSLMTIRLVLAAGVVQNEAIRQQLTDAIAKAEMNMDQAAAGLNAASG
jgi:hypothetical protein